MKKKIILTIVVFVFSCAVVVFSMCKAALAQTLYLKNGRKVHGKIVEKNEKFTRVDVSGVKVTYFADEIDHIEEAAVPLEAPAAVAPAPTSPAAAPTISSPVEAKPIPVPPADSSKPTLPKASEVFSAAMPEGTKKELILNLLESMGTKEALQAMLAQVNAQASVQEREKLKNALNLDEVLNRLVPVYDKYFSEEEIKVLISFYKSPVGRKLIKVTPALMEDSMKANVSYFQEVLPKSLKQNPAPAKP